MSEVRKFKDLTKEQQLALKSAGAKFLLKMFFNGVNYGGLIFASNLILVLIHLTYTTSSLSLIGLCAVVDIVLLNMLFSANKTTSLSFQEQAKKILDTK